MNKDVMRRIGDASAVDGLFRTIEALALRARQRRMTLLEYIRQATYPSDAETYPEGRHLFYEGKQPEAFVALMKSRHDFDPSADNPDWGYKIPAGDGHAAFTSYPFHCPADKLDCIWDIPGHPIGT